MTRKMAFSWRLVAILTFKSFVTLGYVAVACLPQDSWSSTISSGKANDQMEIGNVLFSQPVLKLKMGKIQWLLWRTLGAHDKSTCVAELSY